MFLFQVEYSEYVNTPTAPTGFGQRAQQRGLRCERHHVPSSRRETHYEHFVVDVAVPRRAEAANLEAL